MKELAASVVQLFAIILITITFAVSVAALSTWADSVATTGDGQVQAVTHGTP
ncbi:MAG: hypothetical protein ACJ741_18520 [Pyrinomonadaceae bacterium]